MRRIFWIAVCLCLPVSAYCEETFFDWATTFSRMKGVKPVDNETYKEECGGCHFAYPPGLQVTEAWKKILNPEALEDHFGENAELDEDVLAEIRSYVLENAADKSYYKRSRKITRAAKNMDSIPLRITQNRYIERKHHEIGEDMMENNPDVQSHSNCNACHTKAEEGIFDDDTVRIPNFPDWND